MVKKEKYVVVKYGGNAFGNGDEAIFNDINQMKKDGINVVLVHGGGPEITKGLESMGIKSEFKGGLRVTKDQTTAKAISEILTGIGERLASRIENGVELGKGSNTLIARKKQIVDVDLGYVGEVAKVDNEKIKSASKNGIPVVSPVAQDENGNYYNINADDAALAVAVALKAEKLAFLTNVDGVLKDVNNPDSLLSNLTIVEASNLIKEGTISGGMIPKIRSCINGVKNGVGEIYIANGTKEKSPLMDLVKGNSSLRATKIFRPLVSNEMVNHYRLGGNAK